MKTSEFKNMIAAAAAKKATFKFYHTKGCTTFNPGTAITFPQYKGNETAAYTDIDDALGMATDICNESYRGTEKLEVIENGKVIITVDDIPENVVIWEDVIIAILEKYAHDNSIITTVGDDGRTIDTCRAELNTKAVYAIYDALQNGCYVYLDGVDVCDLDKEIEY